MLFLIQKMRPTLQLLDGDSAKKVDTIIRHGARGQTLRHKQTHFKGVTLHLSARMIAWSPAPVERK
jgi:hypothetical protein